MGSPYSQELARSNRAAAFWTWVAIIAAFVAVILLSACGSADSNEPSTSALDVAVQNFQSDTELHQELLPEEFQSNPVIAVDTNQILDKRQGQITYGGTISADGTNAVPCTITLKQDDYDETKWEVTDVTV